MYNQPILGYSLGYNWDNLGCIKLTIYLGLSEGSESQQIYCDVMAIEIVDLPIHNGDFP